ncbi:MAG: acyl-CoA reductase, partial [Pseudonocardia sediminis]
LSPAGPVLLVGSGNSFVPAVMATTTALLAGCPVAVRGSRVNHALLERVFALLADAGDATLAALVGQVYPFFLDHRDPVDARRLRHLAATGPFAVGNFWGGGDALDELCAALGRNPRHPVAVPMEPLSGVALLSGDEVATDRAGYARALAAAMTTLGQQMCSSPTAAVFVGDADAARAVATDVAAALEQVPHTGEVAVPPGVAMRLDRVRDRCAEEGATVLLPSGEGPEWTVMVSEGTSVVDALPAALAPHIHDRRHFLEIVAVPDLDAAADRIAAQPSGPCHTGVVAVQTLLTFCSTAEAEHVATGLRRRGAPAFRIVPPARVMLRHALEPLDGRHLLAAFTRQTVLVEPPPNGCDPR